MGGAYTDIIVNEVAKRRVAGETLTDAGQKVELRREQRVQGIFVAEGFYNRHRSRLRGRESVSRWMVSRPSASGEEGRLTTYSISLLSTRRLPSARCSSSALMTNVATAPGRQSKINPSNNQTRGNRSGTVQITNTPTVLATAATSRTAGRNNLARTESIRSAWRSSIDRARRQLSGKAALELSGANWARAAVPIGMVFVTVRPRVVIGRRVIVRCAR